MYHLIMQSCPLHFYDDVALIVTVKRKKKEKKTNISISAHLVPNQVQRSPRSSRRVCHIVHEVQFALSRLSKEDTK